MKKMAILLVGAIFFASVFLVAAGTGEIEKLRIGVKSADCKSIVYVNPNSISAINSLASIDTDRGMLYMDPETKALYDEGGTLVATRMLNSEYIPAGFDKNMDGILRGDEAREYSRFKFSQFSGSSNLHPERNVWDAYVKANFWEPAGIDNPYTPQDESADGECSPRTIYIAFCAAALLLVGALALYFLWKR